MGGTSVDGPRMATSAAAATNAVASPRSAGSPARLSAIANPPAGAIYSIDPTLRADFQALPLRAVTAAADHDHLDGGRRLARHDVVGTDRCAWPLRVGTHRIEARDADGRRAEAAVMVK